MPAMKDQHLCKLCPKIAGAARSYGVTVLKLTAVRYENG